MSESGEASALVRRRRGVTASAGAPVIDVPADRHRECLAVLHAGFGTAVAELGLTVETAPGNAAFWQLADLEAVAAKGNQLLGVETGGRLVGCAFVGPLGSRPGTWLLRNLAVAPDARRQGFGEALVGEAARRAQAGGAHTLRLGIVAANRRLAGWYQELGFAAAEVGVRYAGLGFDVDHFELSL